MLHTLTGCSLLDLATTTMPGQSKLAWVAPVYGLERKEMMEEELEKRQE